MPYLRVEMRAADAPQSVGHGRVLRQRRAVGIGQKLNRSAVRTSAHSSPMPAPPQPTAGSIANIAILTVYSSRPARNSTVPSAGQPAESLRLPSARLPFPRPPQPGQHSARRCRMIACAASSLQYQRLVRFAPGLRFGSEFTNRSAAWIAIPSNPREPVSALLLSGMSCHLVLSGAQAPGL